MALNQKTVSDIAEKLGMPEVLTQFLAPEAPEEEVNPFADALSGVHVFNQSDLATRIANETEPLVLKAKNDAIGNTYGAMDKRIQEETGVEKLPNEKTIDYLARAAKEKFGTKTSNESDEVAQLRRDIQAKDELLRTKDSLLAQKDTELEQVRVENATALQRTQLNAKLDAAINALPIEGPQDRLDSQREFLKYKLEQTYSVEMKDGREIFTEKSTGKEMRDDRLGNPLTASDLIAQFAPSVVPIKKVQKRGTGLENASTPPKPGTEDLTQFSSLDAYKKHLTENGIALISEAGKNGIARYIEYQKSKK